MTVLFTTPRAACLSEFNSHATQQEMQHWLVMKIKMVASAMVELTTKVMGAVALAFPTRYLTAGFGGNAEGINSMALQQGGLGLVMTVLILSALPMAAAFFQGVLANFTPYSQFGGSGGAPMGQRPGESGYRGGASAPAFNQVPAAGQYEPNSALPTGGVRVANQTAALTQDAVKVRN